VRVSHPQIFPSFRNVSPAGLEAVSLPKTRGLAPECKYNLVELKETWK